MQFLCLKGANYDSREACEENAMGNQDKPGLAELLKTTILTLVLGIGIGVVMFLSLIHI